VRVTNQAERHISYHLNILGLRVWEDRFQLVAKDRSGHWVPLGSARPLPMMLPDDPDRIDGNPLLLTAYQFDLERPGSDLRSVLAKTRDFEEALNDPEVGSTRVQRPEVDRSSAGTRSEATLGRAPIAAGGSSRTETSSRKVKRG
jgi:hypothetical protein